MSSFKLLKLDSKCNLLDDIEFIQSINIEPQKGNFIKMEDNFERKIVEGVDYYYTKSVTALVSGMAHELKSPLQSIRGALEIFEIILGKKELDLDGLQKVHKIVCEQKDKINYIIKSMSLCGKELSSSNIEYSNLSGVIEDIKTVFENTNEYKASGCSIMAHIDDDVNINTIPAFIFHILTNLLSNSCNSIKKKNEDGIIKIIGFRHGYDMACIDVIDNGVGIEKAEWEKIFRPFYSHRMTDESSGLGLFVAKAMVNRLGGSIFVERSSKEETIFRFFIRDMKVEKNDESISS